MKILNKKDWSTIIYGANLLGTGGGGTINMAKKIIIESQNSIRLISLNELNNNDLVCTVFGVGGKSNCNAVIAIKKAFSLFQKINKKPISAIVPVEVGPEAIATTILISNILELPILDSDFVGLRSSPEVFLETISLGDLNRFPCAISDDKGNSAVLYESQNLDQMEQFFRNFAVSVGGDAFVAGYPLIVKDLKGIIPEQSISQARRNGLYLNKLKTRKITLSDFCINTEWKLLGEGIIKNVIKDSAKGFSQGEYQIQSEDDFFNVIFKNENLVILKNNKVILTCPDLISLLDLENFNAVNNFDDNINKNVAILGKKAIPIWRTKKGKELFSPKNLGINCRQKLLS